MNGGLNTEWLTPIFILILGLAFFIRSVLNDAKIRRSATHRTRKRSESLRTEDVPSTRRVKPNRRAYRAGQWMPGRSYAEYLRSNKWRDLRQQVFQRDGPSCQLCGGTSELQIHHLTYEPRGRESVDDLTVLCKKCHKRAHREGLLGVSEQQDRLRTWTTAYGVGRMRRRSVRQSARNKRP
jgi:5-methylcytosine-specific restriction endonuclease McrA